MIQKSRSCCNVVAKIASRKKAVRLMWKRGTAKTSNRKFKPKREPPSEEKNCLNSDFFVVVVVVGFSFFSFVFRCLLPQCTHHQCTKRRKRLYTLPKNRTAGIEYKSDESERNTREKKQFRIRRPRNGSQWRQQQQLRRKKSDYKRWLMMSLNWVRQANSNSNFTYLL